MVWVWANVEATAKPNEAIVAVSMIDIFMSDNGFGPISGEPINKNRCASRRRM